MTPTVLAYRAYLDRNLLLPQTEGYHLQKHDVGNLAALLDDLGGGTLSLPDWHPIKGPLQAFRAL